MMKLTIIGKRHGLQLLGILLVAVPLTSINMSWWQWASIAFGIGLLSRAPTMRD